jgi:V/A-type H+-transporting ATPase subunit F
MSDIAFIGDHDTVWPFKTLGSDVFFSDEHDSPARLVAEVLQRQFKLIFVTEDFYEAVRDQVDALREQAIPTFAVLPSVKGSRGIALQLIRDSVRKAMGAEFI